MWGKVFWANGKIRETGTFINGLKEGSWIDMIPMATWLKTKFGVPVFCRLSRVNNNFF